MTKICAKCGATENLENWGDIELCPACVKWLRKEIKINKVVPDIKIEYSNLFSDGSFDHGTKTIELKKFHSGERLITVITHEFMHHLLDYFVDLRTSYQYDNVSGRGEFDAVRS